MGCCASRPDDGDSPYGATTINPDHPDASSRHITAGSNRTSTNSHPTAAAPRASTGLAPNLPIKPIPQGAHAKLPSPTQATSVHHSGPWTRARLARERNDWWDTRTEGSRYIWQTYQEAVRLLQEGDLKSAQAVIDASGCTCPTGELWKRIYDNHGVEYSVARAKWVVLEPEGIVSQGGVDTSVRENSGEQQQVAGSSGVDATGAGSPVIASPTSPGQVRGKVTCRLSDTGKDVRIGVDSEANVGDLIRAIETKVGYFDKRLRVAFLGHEHYPEERVDDFYQEGKVLTVMVLPGTVKQ